MVEPGGDLPPEKPELTPGAGWGVGFGGYLREDRQHREHRRYREHPAGEEAPLSDAHRQEGRPPAPLSRGCSALPEPDTHSGARRTGTASLAGKPTRTLRKGQDKFSSPREPLYPSLDLLPSPCPPAPAHSDLSRGLSPFLDPVPRASLGKHPPGRAVSPTGLAPSPRPRLLAEDPQPWGLQHSPSAQEHRSPRGCRARPRRKDNIEGPALERGTSGDFPGVMLSPLLTLGPAGPGSPLAPSRPLKPWGVGERRGGVRRGPLADVGLPLPLNLAGGGGGTHPVTLHARETGGSWETTGTLGGKRRW